MCKTDMYQDPLTTITTPSHAHPPQYVVLNMLHIFLLLLFLRTDMFMVKSILSSSKFPTDSKIFFFVLYTA